ncbi:MAG: hypothetical protein P4L66_14910 [Acetobacteraceae bacterium]|nr:hypothetical protein [Acetobacteraceae bacterium]
MTHQPTTTTTPIPDPTVSDPYTQPTAPAEDPRVAALERKLQEQTLAHQSRLTQAELKLHAVRAGMIDLDGLKLVDPGRVRLTDKGEIDGADRLMADLRREKPWLFHHATTSTPGAAPPSTPPSAKSAQQMSHAEWQAARTALLKRR